VGRVSVCRVTSFLPSLAFLRTTTSRLILRDGEKAQGTGNQEQVGRIGQEREEPDARGDTGCGDTRHVLGCKVIQDQSLPEPPLRYEHLPGQGQKHLAIGNAFDRHGGDQPLETPGAQYGHMTAPLAGLRRPHPPAPGRTGVKAAQRLMAAGFKQEYRWTSGRSGSTVQHVFSEAGPVRTTPV
jgi:hypothetical protein